jgi:hypothetical protein
VPKRSADKVDTPLVVASRQARKRPKDNGKPIASEESPSASAFQKIAQNLAQQIAISNSKVSTI